MKVKLIGSGEMFECNNSYAARLIEQGKAVLPAGKTAKQPEEKPEAQSAESKGNKPTKKGK